jgi:hypothetical protein
MTATTKRSEIISKSQPSLDRPRLRPESERRLAEVEQRSARCYADAEELADGLDELAKQIEAAPEMINFDEPSAVHHIEHLERIVEEAAPELAIPRTRSKQGLPKP